MARNIVHRKSNNWDTPADIIRAEHRMNALRKRERRKRKHTKVAEEFWNGGKQEQMKQKKRKCISTQEEERPTATQDTANSATKQAKQPQKIKENKKVLTLDISLSLSTLQFSDLL